MDNNKDNLKNAIDSEIQENALETNEIALETNEIANSDSVKVDPHLEIEKYREQNLRLSAEIENVRKRGLRDLEEANKYSITKFAKDLIEVLENLYRAEASINIKELEQNLTLKQIFSGVELTKKTMLDAFEKQSIKRIDPMGEQFHHDYHQAIVQIPSKEHKSGTIVQVIQAGYTINDRLLRPALVAVAKEE